MSQKKLLIVVDMQKDFVDGALGTKEARDILPSVFRRIGEARAANETVVFTRDTHGKDYFETQEGKRLPVAHCEKESAGWQLIDGLRAADERIFDKPAFGSVGLAEFVQKERFECAELIGVCTDICVISNALLLKAYCPELRVCVRADCCAGVTPNSHEIALNAMRACQVDIL